MENLKLWSLLIVSVIVSSNLFAGTVVRTQESNAAGQVVSENEILSKDYLLAVNARGEDRVIFNAREQVFTVVIGSQRSYLEIGEEQIAQFGEVMANAQRQIDQALQAVPANQRERMRQMMASRMPGLGDAGKPAPEFKVEATGESREISGYTTQQYIVSADGQRVSELWVAPWNSLEGGATLKDNIESMAGFMQGMLDMMPNMGMDLGSGQDIWMRALDSIDGFPVESLYFEGRGNRPVRTITLTAIESRELGSELFSVPEGYRRQEMELPRF
ncbi:MAG: DUF4412 domain-containing protein [Opitutales bacterium]|nr:DUF4412 domain-containing protein [Opitutales bacterium]